MQTIKLAGKKVNVFENEEGHTIFGSDKAAETVVLRDFGEINGFLNAMGDMKDGAFADLSHGFHMHKERSTAWNSQDALYVRWVHTDEDHRNWLRDLEIVPNNKQAWFVLNRRGGIWIPGYPVRAFTREKLEDQAAESVREDLIAKGEWDASDETLPVLSTEELTTWTINNKHAWNQTHYHNGLELALYVREGEKSVELNPRVPEGQESRFNILTSKVSDLVEGRDAERQQKRAEATLNGQERDRVAKGASVMARNPEYKEKVQSVVAGGCVVIVGGAEQTLEPSRLVGAVVRRVKDGLASGNVYLKDENAVAFTYRQASLFKQQVEVVRFAS